MSAYSLLSAVFKVAALSGSYTVKIMQDFSGICSSFKYTSFTCFKTYIVVDLLITLFVFSLKKT